MPFAKHLYIHQKSDQPTDAIMQPLDTYTCWFSYTVKSDKSTI